MLRWIAALGCLVGLGGCKPRSEVIVFHADSLTRVFGELAERLQQRQPGLSVRLEPSGSTLAARKVAEQGLKADIVAVADEVLLKRLLVPQYAQATVPFATNALVLAHLGHSPGTADVTAENWPEIVLKDGVRLGCADPDLAPIGYQTVLVWHLAEDVMKRAGLAERLVAACHHRALAQDEPELLALLEAKAIDYAFLYASTAEDHRLKVIRLPDEVNLSRGSFADAYSRVWTEVRPSSGSAPVHTSGRPISYGLVILSAAPNPAGARAFVELLASDEGQRTLERHGFRRLEARAR